MTIQLPADPADIDAVQDANARLESVSALERLEWAVGNLPGPFVVSSSFGAQAALTLHLITRFIPDIPVILIDTGYLFPETYQFADLLTARLRLNLKVYRSQVSPAWQEARHGRLWEQGAQALEEYNQINKVEPMRRALAELEAQTWVTGLRRAQSNSRRRVPVLEWRQTRWKLCPVVDWTDQQVWRYLKAHDLPYHPLWQQGYVSIGDTHSTRPLQEGMSEEQTRFFGLKRECGLHLEI